MTKRGRYGKKARCSFFFFSVRSNGRSTTLSLHYQGIIIIPLSDVRSSSGTRHGERGMKERKKKEGRNDDPRGSVTEKKEEKRETRRRNGEERTWRANDVRSSRRNARGTRIRWCSLVR